jgi:hypothetical protein
MAGDGRTRRRADRNLGAGLLGVMIVCWLPGWTRLVAAIITTAVTVVLTERYRVGPAAPICRSIIHAGMPDRPWSNLSYLGSTLRP